MLLIWSRLPTEQWREVNDHEVLVQGRWTICLLDRQRYQFLTLAQDDPRLELGNGSTSGWNKMFMIANPRSVG